jgi:hypothetical protein
MTTIVMMMITTPPPARPRGRVVAALVGDDTGTLQQFDARPGNDGMAGIISPDTDNLPDSEGTRDLKTFRTVSIDKVPPPRPLLVVTYCHLSLLMAPCCHRQVLRDFGTPSVIDFLSLDIEGAEHLVLGTFPWHTHTVYVTSIERPDLCCRTYLRKVWCVSSFCGCHTSRAPLHVFYSARVFRTDSFLCRRAGARRASTF